jgi:hypothetical protein
MAAMMGWLQLRRKESSVAYPSGGHNQPSVPQDSLDAASSGDRPSPAVDALRLWTGGVATALVAALVALVGVLIARGLFEVSVLGPADDGSWEEVSIVWLLVVAAVAALVATGLLHLLLLSTPQPRRFFSWIVGLTTAAAALVPLLVDAERSEQLATAGVAAAVGLLIGSLLSGVASRATRVPR